MKARIYVSNKNTLFLALEDIFLKFTKDYFIDEFDFIIFAVSPKFDPNDINSNIQKIFNTKNYLAFNATDAFAHTNIAKSVTALFIKFENRGKINIKKLKEVDPNKLNLIFIPNTNNIYAKIDTIKAPLIGGICSGEEAYIYYDNQISKKEPLILEFENVEYEFGISLGYQPIGPTYKVQLSDKNKIYIIDNERAPDIINRLLRNTDGNIQNLWYSPLLVLSDKEGIVEVVRTFKDITDTYVEFFGSIEKDSKVKFSFATDEMLLEEDKKIAKSIKKRISPDIIFNFSCIAREFILGDNKIKENQIYSQILNAPLFGFFTYGEIAPDFEFKKSKLYNQSSLVVAIKEI